MYNLLNYRHIQDVHRDFRWIPNRFFPSISRLNPRASILGDLAFVHPMIVQVVLVPEGAPAFAALKLEGELIRHCLKRRMIQNFEKLSYAKGTPVCYHCYM